LPKYPLLTAEPGPPTLRRNVVAGQAAGGLRHLSHGEWTEAQGVMPDRHGA
jgi:hypothetical protein